MTDSHMPRVEAGEAEKPDLIDVAICDGKYRIIQSASGRLRALRYGEEWRDLLGDILVLALAEEVETLRAAALNPAPAPQDTAEAMAEVERLVQAVSTAAWNSAMAAEQSDNENEKEVHEDALRRALKAARALADRATTAEAALASLRAEREPPGEWQDISTAPKDGTPILIYRCDVNRVVESRWDADWKHWHPGSGLFHPKHATHWRPLPAPHPHLRPEGSRR